MRWLLIILVLASCGTRPPKVDHIEVNFRLIPFYEDLFSINPDSLEKEIPRLVNDYGQFLEAYTMRVIGAGSPVREGFDDQMKLFLQYPPNREVLDTCLHTFGNTEPLRQEIEEAFQYYRYYFPDKLIPDVYLHISGFNQSILIDSAWVSVSLEKYLGSDCIFYERLAIPVYLRQNMTPEKVAPDILKAMAMTEFVYNDSVDNLMAQMVHHGMIIYFLKQMMPRHPEELLFGFTAKQTEWCRQYEATMWASIVERKHLFNSDRLVIHKYVGESPFSYYFGQDSPGRAGVYIGYRIVESFMNRNPEVSLPELMAIRDYNNILSRAAYRP